MPAISWVCWVLQGELQSRSAAIFQEILVVIEAGIGQEAHLQWRMFHKTVCDTVKIKHVSAGFSDFPNKFPPFPSPDSHPLRPRLGQHHVPWPWTRTNPSKAIVPAVWISPMENVFFHSIWKNENMNQKDYCLHISTDDLITDRRMCCKLWDLKTQHVLIYAHRNEEKVTKILDILIKPGNFFRTFIVPVGQPTTDPPQTSARSRSTCRRASQPRQEVWRFKRDAGWGWFFDHWFHKGINEDTGGWV